MAIFAGEPDHAAEDRIARQMGLQIVREPAPPTLVWADHWQAARLFAALQTQWRRDALGRLACLRYEAAAALATDIYQVSADERADTFDDLRVMEASILDYQASRQGPSPGTDPATT